MVVEAVIPEGSGPHRVRRREITLLKHILQHPFSHSYHHHLLYYGHSAFAVERPGITFLVPYTYIQHYFHHQQTPRYHTYPLSGNSSRRSTASRTRTACETQTQSGGTPCHLSTNTQAFAPSNSQEGTFTYSITTTQVFVSSNGREDTPNHSQISTLMGP